MARPVRWSGRAADDVDQAAEYITRESRYYAARLVEQVNQAVRTLTTFPERGRVVFPQDPDVREIIVQSYRLIYKIYPDRIEIAALIHVARDLAAAWQRDYDSRPEN